MCLGGVAENPDSVLRKVVRLSLRLAEVFNKNIAVYE
jgi:hypothetical protein